MYTFLLVAAGVFVGLLLFLLVAIWIIKRKLKSALGEFGDAIKAMGGLSEGAFNLRMRLQPAADLSWHHPAEIASLTDSLSDHGFQQVGLYTANDNLSLPLGLFCNQAQKLIAVVYDTPDKVAGIDVAAFYHNNDTQAFFTNVKAGGCVDKPPSATYHRHPELSHVALLEAALAGLPAEGRDPVEGESAPQMIEDFYYHEQLWRVNRGGYTEDEVRRTIAASGEDATPEHIVMSRRLMQSGLSSNVAEELHKQLLEQATLSASEYDDIQYRIAVVHPMTDADEIASNLIRLIAETDNEDEDAEDDLYDKLEAKAQSMLESSTPIEVFTRMAQDMPRGSELKQICELHTPIPAVFYVLPDDDD